MKIHLLRGRVAIRPIVEERSGPIFLPDQSYWTRKDEQGSGIRAKSSHFGKVLGMGPPAIGLHGHEVPHGFQIGDTVNYAMHVNEKSSEGQMWEDGEPCFYIAQESVNGVLE